MIKGIEIFRNYFEEYKDQYVLIGGAACDIIMEEIERVSSHKGFGYGINCRSTDTGISIYDRVVFKIAI